MVQKHTVFVIACPVTAVKVEEFFTFDVILSIMTEHFGIHSTSRKYRRWNKSCPVGDYQQ
jgi:hypothetical protein